MTFNQTETSQVQYGIHGNTTNLSKTAVGHATKFVVDKVVRYIHRATLSGLDPLTQYGMYRNTHCKLLLGFPFLFFKISMTRILLEALQDGAHTPTHRL